MKICIGSLRVTLVDSVEMRSNGIYGSTEDIHIPLIVTDYTDIGLDESYIIKPNRGADSFIRLNSYYWNRSLLYKLIKPVAASLVISHKYYLAKLEEDSKLSFFSAGLDDGYNSLKIIEEVDLHEHTQKYPFINPYFGNIEIIKIDIKSLQTPR